MRHSHIHVPTWNVQWTFMGGYLNYMYIFVWQLPVKNILFYTFNRSVNNAQFFFYQIYVCNGTNKGIQHTEFSFLPVSKAIKAVSSINNFGVSTAIITFFVGDACWTLDSRIKAANYNAKLTKKFISVAV